LSGDSAGTFSTPETRAVANSSTDIVLGVARAADPLKYRAAVERLRSISAEAASGSNADAGLASASVAASPASPAPVRAVAPARVAYGPPRQAPSAGDACGKLEAFVLQTFIQSMLPKNAEHVFGKGTAGEIWKSMLAEKLGNEIAKSGQIGIAERLTSPTAATALLGAQSAPRQAESAEASAPPPSTSSEQS
jgi:hypothetical protein